MLSDAQIETFRRDGVIVLRNFYPPDVYRPWQEQIFDYFEQPRDTESWKLALARHKGDSFQPRPDISPAFNARLASVYRALHPAALWTGRTRLIIRTGEDQAEWRGARLPHIDVPYNAPIRTLINNVTYLSEIRSRGGAFMYWPGSHRVAWDYFCEFPEDFLAEGERSYNQVYGRLTERMETDPIEFIGSPGDVLILHSLTLHSASVNKRPETRIAVFGTWGVETELDRRHEFSGDLWRGWSIAREEAVAC